MKSDVYVNLPTGYGKSVVFQALPAVLASVDYNRDFSLIVNLMKDHVYLCLE